MLHPVVANMVNQWIREYDSSSPEGYKTPQYSKIASQIEYLSDQLYNEYEVTKYPPYQEFDYRLRDWLCSAPLEKDQKILFQLVPRIFFIGSQEYLSLYRSAYNGPIARWLIEQLNIPIDTPDLQNKMKEALRSTWICAITDSMQIAKFYHVNQIEGVNFRPDWQILEKFGSPDKILEFMNARHPKIDRIVLLEDFVGTGSQLHTATEFAASLNDCPVLLCPLVVCPSGFAHCTSIATKHPNLQFSPVLSLDESVIHYKLQQEKEEPYWGQLRDTVMRLASLVKGSDCDPHYKTFGFGEAAEKGGILLVMYTNCPDNTLPIVHHESDGPWKPLFPRSSRV